MNCNPNCNPNVAVHSSRIWMKHILLSFLHVGNGACHGWCLRNSSPWAPQLDSEIVRHMGCGYSSATRCQINLSKHQGTGPISYLCQRATFLVPVLPSKMWISLEFRSFQLTVITVSDAIDYNKTWPSSYADGGQVSWTQFRSQGNGDLKVSFPNIRYLMTLEYTLSHFSMTCQLVNSARDRGLGGSATPLCPPDNYYSFSTHWNRSKHSRSSKVTCSIIAGIFLLCDPD